jgi:epoxyqueuosine reductase
MSSDANIAAQLRAAARALEFDAFGIAPVSGSDAAAQRLFEFLAAGRHGDMTWMETTAERRAHPTAMWPEARSAIVVGLSYAPNSDPMLALQTPSHAAISVYAQGRDYHDVLKSRLKELAATVQSLTGAEVKVFVDTAPLMEKPLAARAGIGWQGKHTNLVSREYGSWLFLGAILTTAELPPFDPEADYCGSCQRCLDICPTRAFPAPYQLDARRCIAYLTIEYKGHIAREFRKPIGNRVFGCDDCLAVCPWNKFAEASHEARFAASDSTNNPPLTELLDLTDAAFRLRYAGTPVKRTGRDRVVRNALIAAGNSGDVSLLPRIQKLLDDPSPLVRAMAVWALYQLAEPGDVETQRLSSVARETDAAVLAEWRDGPAA